MSIIWVVRRSTGFLGSLWHVVVVVVVVVSFNKPCMAWSQLGRLGRGFCPSLATRALSVDLSMSRQPLSLCTRTDRPGRTAIWTTVQDPDGAEFGGQLSAQQLFDKTWRLKTFHLMCSTRVLQCFALPKTVCVYVIQHLELKCFLKKFMEGPLWDET